MSSETIVLTPQAGARETIAPAREAALERRLRICLLGYRSHPHSGGQGIYLRHLSRALVDLGHDVDVISGEPYPELDPRVRLIKLPGLNLYSRANPLRDVGLRPLRSLTDAREWFGYATGGFPEPAAFGRRAERYLASRLRAYDVVHDNQSLGYGLLALRRMGLPTIATIHHPITVDRALALASAGRRVERFGIRRWHSFLRMQGRVARALTHIIAVSEHSKADIVKDFGVPPDRIEVVYNGVDATLFRPRPEIPRSPRRIMATASADVPLKGLQYLLKAYARLIETRPELELTVVGGLREGGPTDRLLRALGIAQRVEFRTGLDEAEIAALYAAATVAVVPSLYEGFGLPAAEAMASATPVIATTGGALPEVVGDAGVLVPPGDASALGRAIEALLDAPERRRHFALLGRRRMLQRFSWDEAARRTAAFYGRAIGGADG